MNLFFFNPIIYLHLLLEPFCLFTLKVIIDRYILVVIVLIVSRLFCSFFKFLSSFALFTCELMTIFIVMFGLLSLYLFISIIDFWLMVTMSFVFSSLCIYMIMLCCHLTFEWLLAFLLFPPCLLVLISCFTSFCLVYNWATYCVYRWFYYFCLLTFQLASKWLYNTFALFAFTKETFFPFITLFF